MGDKEVNGILQFNGCGYDEWQFRVKIHLESLNLGDVLTGLPPADAAKKEEFFKKDSKAKERLVAFVGNNCLGYIREKTTAKEMWDSLKEIFARKSIVNQILVRKQLIQIKLNDGDSMAEHLIKFENLVRSLKTAGAVLEESDILTQLFMSLPEKFDPLVTAFQNLEGQLGYDVVKQRLLLEDTKISSRHVEEDGLTKTAFAGKKHFKKKFQGKCFKCNKMGHKANECRTGDARIATKGKSEQKSVCFMADANKDSCKVKSSITFKLDSGSSDHLVNKEYYFNSLNKLVNPIQINVAKDDQYLTANHFGKIQCLSDNNVEINLKDVLFVPDLRNNLLSVKKMTAAGIKVTFSKDKAEVWKDGALIATGYSRGSLYEISFKLEQRVANLSNCEEAELWHKRLGHIGQTSLNELINKNMVNGMYIKPDKLKFCDVCVKGKHCRDPFNGTRDRASRPLERIHSDVCGPINPIAWNGSKYFVSFIDDYTHFAVIYPIKKKSCVFEKFVEYEAMATAKFGVSVSKLTIDQGREYNSNEQCRWYKSKGIQIEETIAYSPQQNGVAERFNRTLVEKVRTMQIESNMPKNMWIEAALTGVYLINRSPTKALNNDCTPAEMWYGTKPNLNTLRVFGCKAYAWIPTQNRKKLDVKSKEAVMIGYVPNGYKLWDMKTKRLITARDVKFDESCYPYKDVHCDNQQITIVLRSNEQEGEDIPSDVVPVTDGQQENDGDEATVSSEEYESENAVGPFNNTEDEHDEIENAVVQVSDNDLTSNDDDTNTEPAEPRRSGRDRKMPMRLFDYWTGNAAISESYVCSSEPERFSEISGRSDADKWFQAIDEELQSMKLNKVWLLTKPPKNAKLLKSRWVFKIKYDENGNPLRYKARLVVKGFLQKYGIDYNETYAPVAKLTTVRVVLAIAVKNKYHLHQLDIKTAFLNGELHEEIYMAVPEGVTADKGMSCRLLKSLYGLKQAPKCWNDKLNEFLINDGFKRSKHDYCLYTKVGQTRDDVLYVIMYVDDLMIVGPNLKSIENLKVELSKNFELSDCGVLKHFLGIKIEINNNKIRMSQESNIQKVLDKFSMTECNPVKTPMEKGLQLKYNGNGNIDKPYRELLGSLMYVMLCVRPDICYHVSYLGRFQQQPSEEHWQCLKRVLRYLKGTIKKKLIYEANDENKLFGYADADWANDVNDRKSVSGYIFKVYGCTVSWSSKKQQTVSTSSSEAEYVALSSAVSEAIWLRGLLQDLHVIINEAVTIYEDNRGCVCMATNEESKRSKHIDIKHHFIRDNVKKGVVKIESIGTADQLADICTKSLDANSFLKLCTRIGLYD